METDPAPVDRGEDSAELSAEERVRYEAIFLRDRLVAAGQMAIFQRVTNITADSLPYPELCTYGDNTVDPGLRCPNTCTSPTRSVFDRLMVPPAGIVGVPPRHRRYSPQHWVPTDEDRPTVEDFFLVAQRESAIRGAREALTAAEQRLSSRLRDEEEIKRAIEGARVDLESVRGRLHAAEKPLDELLATHSEEWVKALLAGPNPFTPRKEPEPEPELRGRSALRHDRATSATRTI